MRAIVISPHPDDETLGACGTILKMISQGANVIWLNITNMKPEYGYSEWTVKERAREIEQVSAATGYSAFYDLALQPAALEQYSKIDIISKIKAVFDKEKPELVFLPFSHDAHSDHKVVHDCAMWILVLLSKRSLKLQHFTVQNFSSRRFREVKRDFWLRQGIWAPPAIASMRKHFKS